MLQAGLLCGLAKHQHGCRTKATLRLHGTSYKHRLHCLSHVLSLKVLVVIIMQAVHWRLLCKGREAWRVTWNAVPSRA